jgi:uncharacterized membrane protein YfcA
MTLYWKNLTEKQVAIVCVLSGFAVALTLSLVPIFASSKGSQLLLFFWLVNAGYYWLPQAIILGLLMLSPYRFAVISGTAIVLALYLVCFWIWVFSHRWDDGSLAWLGYLFSLPGAGIGAFVGELFIRRYKFNKTITISVISALCTFIGLVINQTIICSTVMYCGF